MSLKSVPALLGQGGIGLNEDLPAIVKELQGLNVSVIAGAAAGTKMDVAALRTEDTILAAVVSTDAGGALADDAANITIQATKASGTLTVAAVNAEDTCVVNGVTYTFKAAPTLPNHVLRTAGDNNANALALANAINAYESRYNGAGNNVPAVVASANSAVVTITSVVDGAGNGVVVTGTTTTLEPGDSGTAAATLTPATVVADNVCVVNGVTFTAKAEPTGLVQFDVETTDALQGAEIARVINLYEQAYGTLDVVATAHATTGVVTLAPRTPKAGNIIVLTGTAVRLAASGSGTLANGTNTGGIKSTTNLSSKSVILYWFNKQ